MFDDFEALRSFPAGLFDLLFSNRIVEHLSSLKKDVLEVTAGLVTPGGLASHLLLNLTGATARNGSWVNWIGEEHPHCSYRGVFRCQSAETRFRNRPLRLEPV